MGDRGSKYRYKWAIISPPVKRHWNGVSLAGRWWPNIECWLCSFVLFQGNKETLYFCNFAEGGGGGGWSGPPLTPPLGPSGLLFFVIHIGVKLKLISLANHRPGFWSRCCQNTKLFLCCLSGLWFNVPESTVTWSCRACREDQLTTLFSSANLD